MDTEKAHTEKTETEQERKPIAEQMTDLAASAAGLLVETTIKSIAERVRKSAAKKTPALEKKAATTAAATPKKAAKKSGKPSAQKSAKKTTKKSKPNPKKVVKKGKSKR
jgi:hypothetical protein